MEGGQWQSVAYGMDAERGYPDDHRGPSQPAAQMQSSDMKAPAPGLYNPPAAAQTSVGPFGIFAVLLRIAQIVFSLIGFAVMASNKDTIYKLYYNAFYDTYSSYSVTLKFTAVKSYVGLLSLDTTVCFYAIVQLVISIVQKATQGSFISSPTAGCCMITFIFDTVLAHALGAACGAAADSAAILGTDSGLTKGFCEAYGKFCDKANASVAISFVAFAFLALSAAMYPVRLFKALGNTKHV